MTENVREALVQGSSRGNETKRAAIDNARVVIALIAAIIGLVAALIGLWVALRNSAALVRQASHIAIQRQDIAEQAKALRDLREAAAAAFLSLTIDEPAEGRVIASGVYSEMHGTFAGDIPETYKLWVVARDQYNYFLMYPPTQVTRTMHRWSQTAVQLKAPGRWELHVCLADEKASKWFQEKADRNDWSGFASLPEGAETVRYVTVEKK